MIGRIQEDVRDFGERPSKIGNSFGGLVALKKFYQVILYRSRYRAFLSSSFINAGLNSFDIGCLKQENRSRHFFEKKSSYLHFRNALRGFRISKKSAPNDISHHSLFVKLQDQVSSRSQ